MNNEPTLEEMLLRVAQSQLAVLEALQELADARKEFQRDLDDEIRAGGTD